jgi:hypothetical protein
MAAQEDQGMLEELAQRLGLEDDEADNFISSAMKRLGYRARRIFEDDDSGNNNAGNGDFFASKRQARTREIPGRGQRRKASGFGMGQYE